MRVSLCVNTFSFQRGKILIIEYMTILLTDCSSYSLPSHCMSSFKDYIIIIIIIRLIIIFPFFHVPLTSHAVYNKMRHFVTVFKNRNKSEGYTVEGAKTKIPVYIIRH